MGKLFFAAPKVAAQIHTPPPDPEAEAAKARQDMLDRQRRGRAGTIAGSERGFLDPAASQGGPPAAKRLLGE